MKCAQRRPGRLPRRHSKYEAAMLRGWQVAQRRPGRGTALHRLSPYIAMNWRGKPLVSLAAVVNLIGATT